MLNQPDRQTHFAGILLAAFVAVVIDVVELEKAVNGFSTALTLTSVVS